MVDHDPLVVETLLRVTKERSEYDSYGLCFVGSEKELMGKLPCVEKQDHLSFETFRPSKSEQLLPALFPLFHNRLEI